MSGSTGLVDVIAQSETLVECPTAKNKVASSTNSTLLVGLLLFLIQTAFSGYSVISVLYAKDLKVDIFFLILCRSLIAVTLALPLAVIVEKRLELPERPYRWKIVYFAVFGLVSTSLNPIMYLQVIYFTSASYVVILGQLIPIFNTIFTWALGLEKLPSRSESRTILQAVGILTGCGFAVGVSAIGFTYPLDGIKPINWLYGTLLGVFNNLVYSLYHVLQAKLFFRNPTSRLRSKPFTVNAYCAAFGACLYTVGILPYIILKAPSLSGLPVLVAVPILYSSIINSTIGFGLMTWCNRKSSPVMVGASFSMQVVTSILLLKIFTKDTMHASQYGCCVGVVVGVLLVITSPILGSKLDIVRSKPNPGFANTADEKK